MNVWTRNLHLFILQEDTRKSCEKYDGQNWQRLSFNLNKERSESAVAFQTKSEAAFIMGGEDLSKKWTEEGFPMEKITKDGNVQNVFPIENPDM